MRLTNKKTKPELIVLDGATGAGKSLLLKHLHEEYSQSVVVGVKMTTRKKRPDDHGWEFSFVLAIPEKYVQYSFKSVNNTYAVNADEIRCVIARGLTYAICCVDRPTTELLMSEFDTVALYVYRSWTATDLESLLKSRGSSSDLESQARREEVHSIAAQYAEKMGNYDHVILNVGSQSDMINQISKILRLYGITEDALNAKVQGTR